MNTTILLVESCDEQRQTLTDFLHHHLPDVVVISGASSTEGVAQWRNADLVITANRLAPYKGISLVQHLRFCAPTLPIVMYTSDGDIACEAIAVGVTRFLCKGPLHELLDTVCELLGTTTENRTSRSIGEFRGGSGVPFGPA